MTIRGDIRNKRVRDEIAPHLVTGCVWEDDRLSEYECLFEDGRLFLGRAAFARLMDYAPDAPIIRKSDLN